MKVENKTILIVDDDPDILLGLRVRLKANGYNIFFANDGASALLEASKHIPDLIVLDIGLPGDDGFVVMEKIKRIPLIADIPIVVLSASDARTNQARAIAAGAKAFLRKPFDDVELVALIRDATVKPRSGEEITLN